MRRDKASEDMLERTAAEIRQADSLLAAGEQAATGKYERRKSRIHQAHKAARKQAAERIEGLEGRRKYKLQAEMLQATRNRETSLARDEAPFEELKTGLAQDEA